MYYHILKLNIKKKKEKKTCVEITRQYGKSNITFTFIPDKTKTERSHFNVFSLYLTWMRDLI